MSYHYNRRGLLMYHNIFSVFKINTKLFQSLLGLAFCQLGAPDPIAVFFNLFFPAHARGVVVRTILYACID
jgi:hypothetical protein